MGYHVHDPHRIVALHAAQKAADRAKMMRDGVPAQSATVADLLDGSNPQSVNANDNQKDHSNGG